LPALGPVVETIARLGAKTGALIFTAEVLSQIILVAAAAFLALWLGARFEFFLKRLSFSSAPRAWVPPIARVLSLIRTSMLWLLIAWASLVVAHATGHRFALLGACTSLIFAWVVIRLASQVVRDPAWSMVISVTAWSLAALNILGLFEPIALQLDASAIVLGKLRISALMAIRAAVALGLLLWITALLSEFLERRISRSGRLTPAYRAALIQVLRLVLPAVAIVAALGVVGIDLTALAVFSGAVGIGIGLGLQQSMANFVAGLSLLLGKSIQPGDIIAYNGTFGWVTAMSARYVSIRTRDGIAHHIPNSHFVATGVENWSQFDGAIRLHIPVGVAYETDPRLAVRLCLEAARSVRRVLSKPEPICLIMRFGESAIQLELRIWISDPRDGVSNVRSAVMLEVWDRFQRAGIRLPYPQRDVHFVPTPRDDVREGNLEAIARQLNA
jgi:small-conductance mechanosensitive channel